MVFGNQSLLFFLMFGVFCGGCMPSHVQWFNPENPDDDGSYAKTLCDLELGTVGSPEEGSAKDDRDWSYRLFSYPEDLQRCMEAKGYEMESSP